MHSSHLPSECDSAHSESDLFGALDYPTPSCVKAERPFVRQLARVNHRGEQ